jgi:AraC-like DNA-binding protein
MLHTDLRSARPSAATLAVTVDDIRPLSLVAADAGICFADILRGIDLSPEMLDGPRAASISLADYFRILERLSIAAHDETCGLSTRPLLPGATGLVLSNLSNCATLFEAMKAVAHAYNVLHGGAYNRVELHDDRLAYIIDDSQFPYSLRSDSTHVRFTMECVLIFLHGMLTVITGDSLHGRLRRVHTKSERPGQRSYLHFWPAPIRWKSRYYALCYDINAMSMPIERRGLVPSSQAIYRKVIELIECKQSAGPSRRSVLHRLMEAFDDSVFEQVAIAKRLGVSVPTLRRRLQAEGQPSFRVLHDRALNRAARALLAQRHHPRDVAEELGFCDLRSFSRAFKRWNDTTPVAYARCYGSHCG